MSHSRILDVKYNFGKQLKFISTHIHKYLINSEGQ